MVFVRLLKLAAATIYRKALARPSTCIISSSLSSDHRADSISPILQMRVLGWRVTCQPLISKVRLICRACGLSHSTVQGQTSPPHCPAPDAAECQEDPALSLTQACAVCSGGLWSWLVLSVLVSWVWSVSSRKDSREWAASPSLGLPRPTRAEHGAQPQCLSWWSQHDPSPSALGAAIPASGVRLVHCLHPRGLGPELLSPSGLLI